MCSRSKLPALPTTVAFEWVKVGLKTQCDVANGEKRMVRPSGKSSSLKQCKKSCQNAAGCKSITFFNSGWCSHFSTLCTKTKWNDKAVSHRWRAISDMITMTTGQFGLFKLDLFGMTRKWLKLGSDIECDTSDMESSPGQLSSLEQCKESCQTTTGCKSITYFNSGWCSHFSTLCAKTRWNNKAVSYRLRALANVVATTTGAYGLYALGLVP